MKKRKKQLIIVVILLILCVVGIFATRFIDYSADAVQSSLDKIISVDASDISELEIKWGEYVTNLVFEADSWKIKGKNESINVDLVDTALKYAGNVYARKTITEHGDYSEYGLDVPLYTISYVDKDGKQYKYYIGNYNPLDEAFFIKIEGDDNIYTVAVDYADAFSINEDLLLKKTE